MTKSDPITLRLSETTKHAIEKIRAAHAHLNNRTDVIEFALIEMARTIPDKRRSKTMRDKTHFLRLLDQNPNASVGFTIAAAAVYAARYGTCEAADHSTEEWKTIARDLRSRYGESLSADEVRSEMNS